MDNFQRVGTDIILDTCLFYTYILSGSLRGNCCNTNQRWERLSDGEIKTVAQWRVYFTDNPPDCESPAGSPVTAIETTPTTATTITNSNLTGTAILITATGGGTWVRADAFSQVGTTITLTNGDSWSLTQQLVIIQI